MELQIQDLVSSIKKDGIETAKKEAAEIIAKAKEEAASIIAEAKAETSKMKESSEKEIAVFKESAELSATQAKRDAMLSFKKEVQAEFEKILTSNVKNALSEDTMAKLISAAVKDEDVSKLTVELAEVSDGIKAQLAEEIKKGLEIKPSKELQAGFRLAAKDGSGYFDCSDEEISKMLMPFFRELHL